MSQNDLDDSTGMLVPEDLPPDHRSGFVAVVGKPNAGKSTLMNAYLGQKVAIVSPKPQTTRDRLLGILTLVRERGDPADAQIIFVDTPGIHKPLHKLGQYMVETAVRAIPDADVVLFLVDVSRPPNDEDRQIAEILRQRGSMPVLLTLNKADLVTAEQEAANAEAYQALGQFDDALPVSALRGDNLDALLEATIERLPLGPRFYPEGQITDQQTRFIAAELVREQVLRHIRQEIPYSVAVIVDQFKARSEEMTYISANIFVERDTQKPIILGQGGRMIKRIGKDARRADRRTGRHPRLPGALGQGQEEMAPGRAGTAEDGVFHVPQGGVAAGTVAQHQRSTPKMEHRRWPALIRPSTRAFSREARRIPGYSFLDWLHGYVYIRWPYLYIGIGSGNHPLARILGPPVRLVGRLFPATPRHDRETGTFADGYHGKVVPLEAAAQLVTVREDVTPERTGADHPVYAGAGYCAAKSGPHCGPGVPVPCSTRQSLPASRRLPCHWRALCQLCGRAPPPPLAMDQPGGSSGDPSRRARARPCPPCLFQGCHAGPLLCHLQLLFLLLWGDARPRATARRC